MKLIALVGMAGSGKSSVAKLFGKDYSLIRFGDITDEILNKKNLEITEENERDLREKMRAEHGMGAYAKLNLEKIRTGIKKNNVVIDGLYSWEEYLILKKEFPKILLVAVYTPPNLRYERLSERPERTLTKEQGEERDKKEIKNLNKAPPIVMADYTILNVGTEFDLKNNFDKFIEWLEENE